MQGDWLQAEAGYGNAVSLYEVLLDDVMYDNVPIREDDRVSYEKREFRIVSWEALLTRTVLTPVKSRLETLRTKIDLYKT
jgi:hypothetical protein